MTKLALCITASADCTTERTFKEHLLNAELKAVIQELKMYNDDYISSLLENMLGSIFHDHPYHYPIIGYKKDLWSLDREHLIEFYKRYYVPNNATLIVVGPADPEEVFHKAEEAFGALQASPLKKSEHYHSPDISSQSVKIYRDVQQPLSMVASTIPGSKEKLDYLFDVASWMIGSGKGSRLYRRIVEELELATQLESFVYDLMEHGLFVVSFQSKNVQDSEAIIAAINEELSSLAIDGGTPVELQRAIRKTEMDFISLSEDQERCAYLLGKSYLATGDENYLSHYLNHPKGELSKQLSALIGRYLRPSVMHRGDVLPLPEAEKQHWLEIQAQKDLEDARVLARISREAHVESGSLVHQIEAHDQETFAFPSPSEFVLSNGLKVIYHHNPRLPKVDVLLEFKARGYYDPIEKQGLMTFLMDVIQEGTTTYPGHRFSEVLSLMACH